MRKTNKTNTLNEYTIDPAFSNGHNVKDEGDAANDPFASGSLCLEDGSEHVVGTADLSLVARAEVHVLSLSFVDRHALDDYDGQILEQLFGLGVVKVAGFIIPACSLQQESSHCCTFAHSRFLGIHLLLGESGYFGGGDQTIEWPRVGASRSLHHGSDERLRVEEVGNLGAFGKLKIARPVLQLFDSFEQIEKPRGKASG